jgi:hypothetical protein
MDVKRAYLELSALYASLCELIPFMTEESRENINKAALEALDPVWFNDDADSTLLLDKNFLRALRLAQDLAASKSPEAEGPDHAQ